MPKFSRLENLRSIFDFERPSFFPAPIFPTKKALQLSLQDFSGLPVVNRGYAQSAIKTGIVCPNCGNGTGDDDTSIEFKQVQFNLTGRLLQVVCRTIHWIVCCFYLPTIYPYSTATFSTGWILGKLL